MEDECGNFNFVVYSLWCGTLCVYDIILDLVCRMRYDEIAYIDLEMYYEI